MFKRHASAELLEKISLAQAKKMVHAADEAPISFEYDPENFTYFRCRAITANEANGNGDFFPEEHLRQSYKTFIGVGLYKDHDSDSIDKAIGKVLHAEYITPSEGNPYVETICAVDKQLAPDLARRVESGIATSVSMGCGRAGTKITMRDGSSKNIEDIVVGDEVINHIGQPDRVKSLMRRHYDDNIYKVMVTGLANIPLHVTGEHPVWAVSKEQIVRHSPLELVMSDGSVAKAVAANKKIDSTVDYKFDWRTVDELRVGDYVGFPFPTHVDTPDYVTRDFARLAGYYLAEGSFVYSNYTKKAISGICLTFHESESSFISESVLLMRNVFGREPSVKNFPNLRATRVVVHNAAVARRFMEMFGAGSKTKRLHESVLYWDKALQLELVGAFLNGDGFVTSNHKAGGERDVNLAYLETSSYDLARQLCSLLARNGIVWNLERKEYPEKTANFLSGTKKIRASTTYRVSITKRFFNQLSSVSSKVPAGPDFMNGRDVKFFYKNYLMSPVRSIEAEEHDDLVYNFEVEGRNSYLMNGFAVHNCSVREAECGVPGCGNIAHNPQQLCQHMMPGFGAKGRKNPDGSTIYEINRGIQFTELSLVTVPADPTARIFEVYANLNARRANMSRADFIQELVRIAESATAEQMNNLRDYLAKQGLTYENALGSEASFYSSAEKTVERKDNSVEHKMGLSITYLKGSSLGNSFFVARDSSSTYRVAASDVLPIVVQKSIESGDQGVVTPDGLISDLTQKYASVGDFKAWAKRRRKKNRQAVERMKCGEMATGNEKEMAKAQTVDNHIPSAEPVKAAVDKVSEPKASITDNGRSTMDKKADDVEEKVETAAEAATEAPAHAEAEKDAEDNAGEIFAAFNALRKYVESRMGDIQKREAVQTHSHANKAHTDGEHGDKSVTISGKGVEEPKSESPKGHMDKGAAKADGIKVEAMDKDWAVNQKELEKMPKPAKADGINLPSVMSVDRKEADSEAVGADGGGKAGANIKKLYNRLPSGGPGEPPKALDLKSSQDPEKEMLRKALAVEKAKAAALEEKERLQTVADKVYEVVTAMKDNNLLADGKEDAVIDTLTARFADINQLESLKTLVAHLSARRAGAAALAAEAEAELPVGSVVPQVFEAVEQSEDVVLKMASIWNR